MSTTTTSKRRPVLPVFYVTRLKGQPAVFLTVYHKAVNHAEWLALWWN